MNSNIAKSLGKVWSPITFGCWQIAPSVGWGDDACSPEQADAIIKTALDHGITAFDTAEGYGDGESERRLGKALGSFKDDAVIVSKIWPDVPLNEDAYFQRIDGTLKALGRDYVDVYLMHWVSDELEDSVNCQKMCEFMIEIKESGKAKHIGISNFRKTDLERLGDYIDQFSINQVPYSLIDRSYEDETLLKSKKAGISYMAYSPIGRGLLARRMTDEDFQCYARRDGEERIYGKSLYPRVSKVFDVIESIANQLNRTPAEVTLAWTLKQDNILTAIVGSRKPEQIKDFANAQTLTLSKDMLDQLTQASDAFLNS